MRLGEVHRLALLVGLAAHHETNLSARVGRDRREPVLHRAPDEDPLAHLQHILDVAAKLEFEKQETLKPGNHVSVSRVEYQEL